MCRGYKKCAEAIIASRNPLLNFMFARDIKGADIKAHGQVVIASKDPTWNYPFIKIKGADIEAHKKVIMASKNKYFIQMFKQDFKEFENSNRHTPVVLKVKQPKPDLYPKTKKLRQLVIERKKIETILGNQ